MIGLIGHSGEDGILDHIAQASGDNLRSVADKTKFPKIYDSLLEVILSPIERRAGKLKKYVDGWYKRMKPIYWYNSHEGAEGAYFGYWCFEAALIAMLFNIDDAELRGHPSYPYDLVTHFKQA